MELAVCGSGDQNELPAAQLAEQVFMFLVRAVFKPSLSISVAHYFSASLKGMYIHVAAARESWKIPIRLLISL